MKRTNIRIRLITVVTILLALVLNAPAITVFAENTMATEAPSEEVQATEAPSADAQAGEWWNILLLGGDSRNEKTYERTDSMIILSVNTTLMEAKMTSIMRDTWVSYPGMPGHGKINAANVYGGPELSVKTVNECFGTDIKNYVLVNMAGLVKAIDLVGGVDIPVTSSERRLINAYSKYYVDNIAKYDGQTTLEKSGDSVHLNGLQAMSYCRIRNIGTDYTRTQRQRTVLMAVLNKMKSQNAAQIAAFAMAAAENVETNLSIMDILTLANFGLKLDTESSVEQNRIPADGTFQSGMKDGFWSIRPDFEANKKLLHNFIYGSAQ